ncbi:hypothetical protein D3C74_313280 [compost metagenome]
MAFISGQLGEALCGEHDALCFIEDNILASIILDKLRLHPRTGEICRGIQMREKTNGGNLLVRIGRQGSHDISMLVHGDLHQPQLLQLSYQLAGQLHLSGCGRAGFIVIIRLGIHLSIRNKPLYQLFFH